MDFSVFILMFLIMVVVALFGFCLTEARGKHTAHARRENTAKQSNSENVGLKQDPISKSKDVAYNMQ